MIRFSSRSLSRHALTRAKKLLVVALVLAVLFGGLFADSSRSARAAGFSPQSPVVKTMINRALLYLQTARGTEYSGTLGGQCLVGMAFVKNGFDERHPKVKAAVERCQSFCKRGAEKIATSGPQTSVVYSTGIALIFLCSLEDPEKNPGLKYRTEIEALVKSFELRQKAHGGFGYPRKEVGDTSMTQYAVLSYWEASAIGVEPSQSSLNRVANWLIRTQDPSGGFGYQAVDPGNYTPINQPQVRLSLSVAGTGSVYICGDLLGFTAGRRADSDGLPPALRIKPKTRKARKTAANAVDPARLQRAKGKGNSWISGNFKIDPDPDGFTHYYLYALERYYSFREKADGRGSTKWYDAGVRYLKETQDGDGSWNSKGQVVDTAFAVLFLTRATQKSIKKKKHLDGGTLAGRRRLPRKITADVEQQLKILEAGPRDPYYFDIVDYGKEIQTITDKAKLRSMAERFRRILVGGSPSARIVAAEALGKVRDLDNVTTLLYGLTDPDWRVVVQSRDSLRLISRRFAGFGIPDKRPRGGADAMVPVLHAIDKWKVWYRSVRPDAQFIE